MLDSETNADSQHWCYSVRLLSFCSLSRKHLRQLHPEQSILIRSGGPPMRAEEVTARAGQGLDLATLVTPRLLLPKVRYPPPPPPSPPPPPGLPLADITIWAWPGYLLTREVIPHGPGRVSQGTSAPGCALLASGCFAHAFPIRRGATGLLSAFCRPSWTSRFFIFLFHWVSRSNCQSLVN